MITEAELTKWARQAEFNKAFPKSTSPITFTDDDKILSLIAELRELRGAVRDYLMAINTREFNIKHYTQELHRIKSLIEEDI